MTALGKRLVPLTLIGLLIVSFGSLQGYTEDEIWLAGSLEEIKSASPLIGHATMPLALTKAIVNAVPPKYVKETKESGFDIAAIAQAVEVMKPGDVFNVTINDMRLMIRKYTQPKPETPPAPSSLKINSPNLTVPIPLFMTGTAVTLLKWTLDEFAGMDTQLTALIEQVKQTPPGLILEGEDRLMDSWLKIRLE